MNAQQREDLFWNDVDILNDTRKCWNWKLSVDRNGYGKVTIFGKVSIAHRVAYKLWYRIDPGNFHVLHTCDNKRCCNPFHLWLGTHLDNVRDMDRKGRRNPINSRGRKINYDIAEEIRKRFTSGESKRKLAIDYHLTTRSIRDIVNFIAWKYPYPTEILSSSSSELLSDGRKLDDVGGVGA